MATTFHSEQYRHLHQPPQTASCVRPRVLADLDMMTCAPSPAQARRAEAPTRPSMLGWQADAGLTPDVLENPSPATRSTSEPPREPHLGHLQTPEAPSCGQQALPPLRDQLHGAPTCRIQAGDQVSGVLPLTHTFITPCKSGEGPLPPKEGPVRPAVWVASPGPPSGPGHLGLRDVDGVVGSNPGFPVPSVPPFLQQKMEGILGKLLGERPVGREGALTNTAHGRCISGPGECTSENTVGPWANRLP